MVRVCIVALPNVLASSVSGFVDVLGTANVLAEQKLFAPSVRCPSGPSVRTSNGLTIQVTAGLPRPPQHVIILPGIAITSPRQAAERILASAAPAARLFGWLRRQHASGALLVATCSSAFLLAEAGFLDGRCATTTWWLSEQFEERFDKVRLDVGALMTQENNVMTSGAAMSFFGRGLVSRRALCEPQARSVLCKVPGPRSPAPVASAIHYSGARSGPRRNGAASDTAVRRRRRRA